MKITKKSVEEYMEIYQLMIKKAKEIWGKLRELDPDKYEYFNTVVYLSFDEVKSEGVYVSGYDGGGTCGAYIPLEYFYNDDWFEKLKKEMEILEEQKRIMKDKIKKDMSIIKEQRERREYKRLKNKFENN